MTFVVFKVVLAASSCGLRLVTAPTIAPAKAVAVGSIYFFAISVCSKPKGLHHTDMAEGVGFEPTMELPPYRFSRAAH